ncbi:MAG: M23 family metallopeptidase, partial [Chitinivibrionales bacterium]|nr:M23 family metallopeptidase [Chitinivibrionales bacterium]
EVTDYLHETIGLYNKTRLPQEPRMEVSDYAPRGINLDFYPPSTIVNPLEKQLLPVYNFFTQVVSDPYAYVTGDWCERGQGGGVPHYGIDVAARLGEKIITPTDGMALLHNSETAGHVVGVVKDGTVLFFCHMDKRFVASGDMVRKGDILGTVGVTGQTTGPHVHVGYGIRAPARDGVNFGAGYYKLTDPKLFFYREVFLNRVAVN